MDIGKRKEIVLASIIEHYVKTKEPVGSKTLCNALPFTVSPATIRNEMFALSAQGLLEQKHTSGGRIPSAAAYRYYVDNLINYTSVSDWEKSKIDSAIASAANDPQKLLTVSTQLLSTRAPCVSFYTTVANMADTIETVQLVLAGSRAVLLVLVTAAGVIKTSICTLDFEVSSDHIAAFNSFAGAKLHGLELQHINQASMQSMAVSLGAAAFLFAPVLITLRSLCSQVLSSDIFMYGEHSARLPLSAKADEIKKSINSALENCENFQLYIGSENTVPIFKQSTLLCVKYKIPAVQYGVIGLIAPIHIDYAKVIPIFNYTTQFLN